MSVSSEPFTHRPMNATRRFLRLALVSVFVALLGACASVDTHPDPSEYIDSADYDRLKQVSTQPGIRIYRYLSPGFSRAKFRTVMVDPIVLYQTPEKGVGKTDITEESIYRIRNSMDITMRQMVRKQFGISYKPARNVARLSTAITGVLLEGDAFKPRRLVTISSVLKAVGSGDTINGRKPYLMIEAKLLNSTTGTLLGEGVYLVSSEQFRREVDSPAKFQLLANQWVRGAVSVASGLK